MKRIACVIAQDIWWDREGLLRPWISFTVGPVGCFTSESLRENSGRRAVNAGPRAVKASAHCARLTQRVYQNQATASLTNRCFDRAGDRTRGLLRDDDDRSMA